MEGCGTFFDMTEVHGTEAYPYKANGRAWLIRFNGLNEDPG
jgi:hypothetical protein